MEWPFDEWKSLTGPPYLSADNLNRKERALRDLFSTVTDIQENPPQGEKGDPGDPGAPGDKGDKGDPGDNGTNGVDGADGTDGRDGEDAAPVTATARSVAFMKDQPVGIIFGSSSVYGSGTPTATRAQDRFARQLERKLDRRYGVPANRAPLTIIGGDDSSPYISGGSVLNNSGLGKFSRMMTDGTTVTLTPPNPTTGVMIGFREGSSVGNITYAVDGGEPVTVPVGKTGASAWTGKWSSPTIARGAHTYTFTTSGGANIIDFIHFFDETNTRGPILLNGGWGGEPLSGLITKPSTAARLKSVNPDFIFVVTGSNEESAGQSRADVAAAIASFEQMVATNTTGVTWVCYASIDRPGDSGGYDRVNVTGPMRDVAAANPATRSYIGDLERFWTDNTTDRTILGTLSSDNVHPSSTGHAAIADILATALGVNIAPGSVNPADVS